MPKNADVLDDLGSRTYSHLIYVQRERCRYSSAGSVHCYSTLPCSVYSVDWIPQSDLDRVFTGMVTDSTTQRNGDWKRELDATSESLVS